MIDQATAAVTASPACEEAGSGCTLDPAGKMPPFSGPNAPTRAGRGQLLLAWVSVGVPSALKRVGW